LGGYIFKVIDIINQTGYHVSGVFTMRGRWKTMQDFMKKAILMGAGLAVMTTDKVKELIDELVRKGEISEKEAEENLEEWKQKAQQMRNEWEEKIEEAISAVLKRMNIPSRRELEDLKERLARLEQARKE
jgi:polyhydroxyalkanoate synthesis regulator phasin